MRSRSRPDAGKGTLVPQRRLGGRGSLWRGESLTGPSRRPYEVTMPVSSGDLMGSGGHGMASAGESAIWPAEDDHPVLRRQRVEAVLLVSRSPLPPRKLSQLAHLADATEARTLVRELNQIYEEHHRAIRVEQIAGGYRLLTRPSLAPWLARLGHLPPAVRLSSPMMETLAVVAYRQPVSRANVEAVRGVACGELLRQLMERELVRIAGRAEELGRPYLYGTTKRFLQLFGLSNLDALPTIQWQALRDDSETEDQPQEELSTSTKESDVCTAVAETELIEDQTLAPQDPAAAIEDEEDDLYEGTGDFANDDDDDDDDKDDDWDDDWAEDEDDDDDEVDDEEDDDDDDIDDDLEDDVWEEVDDEEADDDFDDDIDSDEEDVDDDEEDWDEDEDDEDDDWGDDDEEDQEDDDEE